MADKTEVTQVTESTTEGMDLKEGTPKDQSNIEDSGAKATKSEAKEEKKDEGPKLLDLAFAMDCTGSMGSYINQAQQNIRLIVEELVAKESADIRLALVEYRDHPPQDTSFVTRVHDFTPSVREMKNWLSDCSASGGGDAPEAVADALHQVLKLSWREDATKICVFISDAPPHGLGSGGDHFENGCPAGLDPMVVTNQLAEKGVTLYLVGCEPSINPYKEFFTALAHVTGGQYVPLKQAKLLTMVIVGGAQEEMSLKAMMEEIQKEVLAEAEAAKELDEDKLTTRIHTKYAAAGKKSKQLRYNKTALPQASARAEELSYITNMSDMKKEYVTELTRKPEPMYDVASVKSYSRTEIYPKPKSRSMKSKKSDKRSSGGGGILSWMFGRSKSEAKAVESDDDDVDEVETVDDSLKTEEEPTYEVAEDVDIDMAQVQRMVHRSVVKHGMTELIPKRKKEVPPPTDGSKSD